MSKSKKLLQLLDILEDLADKATIDPPLARAAANVLALVFERDDAPHTGRPPEQPDLHDVRRWTADVKAYCVDARERVREDRSDERAKDALRAAEALVDEARRIAHRSHKKTSESDPLTELATDAPRMETLYNDHERTDRTNANAELEAFFDDLEESAAVIVREIKRRGKLTASEREWRDSLRELASRPDRYRKTEAAQKLGLLRKALDKLRA